MNQTIITGRLGRDPELKTGASGNEYSQFSVAVDRRKTKEGEEKKTDWFRCTAFGKTAAFIEKYFKKGDGIEIEGRMENDPFEDRDTGKKRDSWQLMVERVEFPKGKSSGDGSGSSSAPVEGFTPVPDIDESSIPF